MKRLIVLISSVSILLMANPDSISADYLVAGRSAELKNEADEISYDKRVDTLRAFLESYDSPLSPYSKIFIASADKYNLDWRLLPAISGVESTFGKHIPTNSYNAYGWASGNYKFTSWEESIDIVSRGLRENYLDRGATSIAKIARWYCPPSNTWAWKVHYFMTKLEPLPLAFTLES